MWKQGPVRQLLQPRQEIVVAHTRGAVEEVTCAGILDVCVIGGANGNFLME